MHGFLYLQFSKYSKLESFFLMATATASDKKIGKVTQVIGSTFDVEFPESTLPIYNAVRIDADHKGVKLELVGEVSSI